MRKEMPQGSTRKLLTECWSLQWRVHLAVWMCQVVEAGGVDAFAGKEGVGSAATGLVAGADRAAGGAVR